MTPNYLEISGENQICKVCKMVVLITASWIKEDLMTTTATTNTDIRVEADIDLGFLCFF